MIETMKVRFRLRVDNDRWVIDRGAWAPKKKAFAWTPVSHHQTIRQAILYAQEHVIREGYSPRGAEMILRKISQATALVTEWAKALADDIGSEMEIP